MFSPGKTLESRVGTKNEEERYKGKEGKGVKTVWDVKTEGLFRGGRIEWE